MRHQLTPDSFQMEILWVSAEVTKSDRRQCELGPANVLGSVSAVPSELHAGLNPFTLGRSSGQPFKISCVVNVLQDGWPVETWAKVLTKVRHERIKSSAP